MKFLIESAAPLSEKENHIYKRDKWVKIGCLDSPIFYCDYEIYEIDIKDLNELTEMCEMNDDAQGVIVYGITEEYKEELLKSGINTQADYRIVCYNSWIE